MRKPRFRTHKINLPQKQTGAALLLFVLLLVVGSTTFLVSKLNKSAAQYYRDDVTMKALIKAKEALIGYAVSYRSASNIDIGPGYLSCPDTSPPGTTGTTGSGFSQSSCGGATVNLLGRFPWRSLGLPDVRDSSGETLWYVLSKNFRNNNHVQPMNSDIGTNSGNPADMLSLNGTNDIAAIIFAPGSPIGSNNRTGSNLIDSAHYLEDSDNDLLDTDFTTPATSNDVYLVLTKQELMREVEKRVLGEVSQVLTNYSSLNGTYPWLSPFENPTTSSFTGTVNTPEGHLPVNLSSVPNSSFTSDFNLSFNIDFTTFSSSLTSIDPLLLTSIENVFFDISGSPIFVTISGSCQWLDALILDATCSGNSSDNILNIVFNLSGMTVIIDPTSQVRSKIGNISSSPNNINISLLASPSTTINLDSSLAGMDMDILIPFGLDPLTDGLPSWFVSNDWHHLIYAAYSPEFVPGGTFSCTPGVGGSCLTLNNQSVPNDDIQALIISAGEVLSTPASRPSANIGDYFENENIQPLLPLARDLIHERNVYPQDWNVFNDQVRVIAP